MAEAECDEGVKIVEVIDVTGAAEEIVCLIGMWSPESKVVRAGRPRELTRGRESTGRGLRTLARTDERPSTSSLLSQRRVGFRRRGQVTASRPAYDFRPARPWCRRAVHWRLLLPVLDVTEHGSLAAARNVQRPV